MLGFLKFLENLFISRMYSRCRQSGSQSLGKILNHLKNQDISRANTVFSCLVFLLKLNLKFFSKNNLKSQRRSKVINSSKRVSFSCISATVRNLQKGLWLQYLSFQPSKRNCTQERTQATSINIQRGLLYVYLSWICASCCFDDAERTLEGITLVTCVRIYLGADSARRYLCPPVTVSVSFRFHSLCNAHSALNCLERNIKWSSCVATACSLRTTSRHWFFSGTGVQAEYRPSPIRGLERRSIPFSYLSGKYEAGAWRWLAERKRQETRGNS